MTGRAAAVALRRHELARVVAAHNPRGSWRMMSASRYTAHAVYDLGGFFIGHMVGTADGWWWGMQAGPGRTPESHRAVDLMDAFLCARDGTRRLNRLWRKQEGIQPLPRRRA